MSSGGVVEEQSHDFKKDDFSHPVYKKISVANGKINRMTNAELHDALFYLKLSTRLVSPVSFFFHYRIHLANSIFRSKKEKKRKNSKYIYILTFFYVR